jgi:hypothetical protein
MSAKKIKNLTVLAAVFCSIFLTVSCASTDGQGLVTPAKQLPFGLSKDNPVEVCKVSGQREYLEGLVCTSGAAPSFKRVRNVGQRFDFPKDLPPAKMSELLNRTASGAKLQPGEPDYHIVDEYEVVCGEKKVSVFLDMYHCDSQLKNPAPSGFSLRSAAQTASYTGVSQVIEQLRKSVASQEYTQIREAIESSPALMIALEKLYSQKLFIEFVVLKNKDPSQPQYGGFERKGRVYLTQDYLQSLALPKLRSPIYADDIQPNNTTFAIAHLLHHASKPIDMSKFANPIAYSDAIYRLKRKAS